MPLFPRVLAVLTVCAFLLLGRAHAQDFLEFPGKDGPGKGKKITLIAGDNEYRSEESLPMLGKILSQRHGFDCTVIFSAEADGTIKPGGHGLLSNPAALDSADAIVMLIRFRNWNEEAMKKFEAAYLRGVPIIALRTSTHAFNIGDKNNPWHKWHWSSKIDGWQGGFGKQVLGETWVAHHGEHKVEGCRGIIEEANKDHPILRGVTDVFADSDVYTANPSPDYTVLMRGQVTDSLKPDSKPVAGKKNDPMQPIVWVRERKNESGTINRIVTNTMGAATDLQNEGVRRLVINSVFWALKMDVPANADVNYVDAYNPSFYGFKSDRKKVLKVADHALGKPLPPPSADSVPQEDKKDEKNEEKKVEKKAEKKADKAEANKTEVDETAEDAADDGNVGNAVEGSSKPSQFGLTKSPKYAQPAKANAPGAAVELPYQPAAGENIILIGNSLGERDMNFGHFETALHQRFPTAKLTFRNMCNPGDTPGFRPHPGRKSQWAFPGAEKFNPGLTKHFGAGHYPYPDEWLTEFKADTIVAFFGYNESFGGLDNLANFKAELAAFIDHTRSRMYNGTSVPRLVLATPIAFEDRSATYDLPKGQAENERLAAYALAVLEVAKAKQVGALDLFTPTKAWFAAKGSALTINGCHLNDAGYAKLAPLFIDGLFGSGPVQTKASAAVLRAAVQDKDYFWMNDYRMLNGVHVWGRRWKPFGNFNYPEEIEKMRQMTRIRDERIWAIASGNVLAAEKKVPPVVTGPLSEPPVLLPPVADDKTRPLTPIPTNFNFPITFVDGTKAIEKMKVINGFKVELFASEKEFPDLQKPVQMSFDNKGRLWVAVTPTYPHYKPGGDLPNDKLLILEDTNGDGKADKQTVFADRLNLPLGFEFAPEGVYVSQEPHLCLLIDDNKDDKADRMEILMTGFDTHDSHHAIHAFSADGSGAFYMSEGRFLHSQVETPYGPERMTDGGVWRFNPRNWRLDRYSQCDYNNPWGVTFDQWGQCFISDASTGENWWAGALTTKLPHGQEVPKVGQFAPKRSRPTSGAEWVYSRHFPDEWQGRFMQNNCIGFLGTTAYDIAEDGSGFTGKNIGDLVASSDPNFRPVDLEFAPDGSLYFIDWHNPLIGHMQHNIRDPNRDTVHGRIYRVTYPARPLVKPPKIAGATVSELLNVLKVPEYRARYRARRELAMHPTQVILPAVKKWVAALDQSDPVYERHVLEALWVTWRQNAIDQDLLKQCLSAKNHQARAAAVEVIRNDFRKIPDAVSLLMTAAKDTHPRVRLAAIVAGSWMDNEDGARIALEALRSPLDRWMSPTTDQVLKTTLANEIKALNDAGKLADNKNAIEFIAGRLTLGQAPASDEEKKFGPTRKLDNEQKKVYELGKSIYSRDAHCITCHQPNGLGLPNIYPPLTSKEWIGGDDERLIKIVLHGLWGPLEVDGKRFDPSKGVPPMMGFGPMLNDKELSAVLTYVRQSFGNDFDPITPEAVKKVRQATQGRSNFWMVDELMKDHPIPGWEKWKEPK
jgi:mono/diheme cytochrome c family protein/glucose/arabinose dehydrogenase